jgi:hypothetical protein
VNERDRWLGVQLFEDPENALGLLSARHGDATIADLSAGQQAGIASPPLAE